MAAAAARAGLNFIVLTDHGDGTREPEPPQYRSGVLVIDGVELSTQTGHYIALGLPRTPYPLRGEARDVVEDVRRLGGFGVVAHADSAKPALRWHDWNVPFDAMEWLNADTEWRDEGRGHLLRALARYPFRPAETLASLLDRPEITLQRWDALTQTRPVVALAGADAHARAGWLDDDANGYTRGWFLRIPSYDASFHTFAMRVPLERPLGPLSNDARGDAARIMSALRAGRVYTAIDAIAGPAALEFSASGATLVARTNASSGTIVLRKDGRVVSQHASPALTYDSKGEHGTYRVEVQLSHAPGHQPVPWIVSNPIYVRPDGLGNTGRGRTVQSNDLVEHSGRSLAHRDRRHLERRGLADRAAKRSRGIHVSSRRRRAHGPARGARDRRGNGTERTHASRATRAGVASDAHLGAGATAAIRGTVAAIDLSGRRDSRRGDSVQRDVRGGREPGPSIPRRRTRCCLLST